MRILSTNLLGPALAGELAYSSSYVYGGSLMEVNVVWGLWEREHSRKLGGWLQCWLAVVGQK